MRRGVVTLASRGEPSLMGIVLARAPHLHTGLVFLFTALFLPPSLSFGDGME